MEQDIMKLMQCVGSGFWLPGSGSEKICGSKDSDPSDKIQPKTAKKNLNSQNPNLNY